MKLIKNLLIALLILGLPYPNIWAEEKVELYPQLGHSVPLEKVVCTPDGKRAISADMFGILKLWDLTSGRLLRTFVHHDYREGGVIKTLIVTPNGQRVIVGEPSTLRVIDLATGQTLWTQSMNTEWLTALAVTPDGQRVIVGSANTLTEWPTELADTPDGQQDIVGRTSTLKVIELATGQTLWTQSVNTERLTALAVTPDGQRVISGDEKTLRVWDLKNGQELRTLTGHNHKFVKIAVLPDGQKALSYGGVTTSELSFKLWDLDTGKELENLNLNLPIPTSDYIFKVQLTPDRKRILLSIDGEKGIGVLDFSSGALLTLFREHNGRIIDFTVTPDGRRALSIGAGEMTFKVWDLATGREQWNVGSQTRMVRDVLIMPDGQRALSVSSDGAIRMWDLVTGQVLQSLNGHTSRVYDIAVTPDGQRVLWGTGENTIKVWDLPTGRELWTLGHGGGPLELPVTAVDVTADGRKAISGSYDATLKVWDLTTGKELRHLTGHTRKIEAVAILPNGQRALSVSHDKTFKLWDLSTGRELWSIKLNKGSGEFLKLEVTPDGQKAITRFGHASFKVWEVATGRELFSSGGLTDKVEVMTVVPNSMYVLSGRSDNSIQILDLATGQILRTLIGHTGPATEITVTPDGQRAVSVSTDGTMKVWEVATAKLLKTFTGHTLNGITSIMVTPDGQTAISGNIDGTLRIWNLNSERAVVRMIGFVDGEWVTMTPEGYYAASGKGDRFLNVRVGTRVSGIDQYRATFYHPEMVREALRLGDSRQALEAEEKRRNQQLPILAGLPTFQPPFLVITSPEDGMTLFAPQGELSLYLEDRHQFIKSVKVFINGRLASQGESRGAVLLNPRAQAASVVTSLEIPKDQHKLRLKVPVQFDAGQNVIEVSAFNGYSEERKTIRVEVPPAATDTLLPNLWILAIGVNEYHDPLLRSLQFAGSDALELVTVLTKQQGQLFNQVHSLTISDYSEVKPTFANIIDHLSYLGRAGEKDVVLLFLAGHGLNDERGDFYFLPSDAGFTKEGSIRRSTAISWREIQAALELPGKKLIFADTCHSEGIGGKQTRAVDTDRLVKELQQANAVIFTSSRGTELSQEHAKWGGGHGVFTFAMLEGLTGKADLIKDGQITMKELDTYVSRMVPNETEGVQHPITLTPDGYVDFSIALTSESAR